MSRRFTRSSYLMNWQKVEARQFAQDACIPAAVEWGLRFHGLALAQQIDVPFTFFLARGVVPTIRKPVVKVSKEQHDLYMGMKGRGPNDPAVYREDFGGAAKFLRANFGKEILPEVRNDFPKERLGATVKVIALEQALRQGTVTIVSVSQRKNSAHSLIAVGLEPPDLLFYDVGRPHTEQPVRIPICEIIRLHCDSDPGWGEDILTIARRRDCILLPARNVPGSPM